MTNSLSPAAAVLPATLPAIPDDWYRRHPSDKGRFAVDRPVVAWPEAPAPWAEATAKHTLQALGRRGIIGSAAEALLAETASYRHAMRVAATKQASIALAEDYLSRCWAPSNEEDTSLLAAIILIADLMGIGGTMGVQGLGTTRLLSSLGPGRWHARSGEAYRSAAKGALAELTGHPESLVLRPDESDCDSVEIVVKDGKGEPRHGLCPVDVLDGPIPEAWLETIVREGLRRAAGLPGWFDMASVVGLPVAFEGSAHRWARLQEHLATLAARRRIVAAIDEIEGGEPQTLLDHTSPGEGGRATLWNLANGASSHETQIAILALGWCREQIGKKPSEG